MNNKIEVKEQENIVDTDNITTPLMTDIKAERMQHPASVTNDNEMAVSKLNRLIIVRHGERVDEVSRAEWDTIRRSHRTNLSRQRDKLSEIHDPHLTDTGIQQAKDASETILKMVSNAAFTEIADEFCS